MGSGTSLEYSARSDVGLRRANNQDAHAVLEPWNAEQYRRRGWLFLVADGMGAHAAGEMASAMAAEQVPLVYEKHAARSPPLALRLGIEQANAEIHARGESSADLRGMGTTCTALALVPRGALVGHVGDSRAYRVRGGTIDQLTQDHSLAWELEARKAAGDADVPLAPKNIITRSLGPHPGVRVDVEGPFAVEPDDVYVLCSDGLSGQVADEEIGVFAAALPPAAAAAALVGLTLVRGAPDNVTVILARAGGGEASRVAAGDTPWLLSEEERTAAPGEFPVRQLAVAAACLLGSLVVFANSGSMAAATATAWWFGGLALALAALASFMLAVLRFLAPGGEPHVLLIGARAGAGPYRSHDCRATAPLVEGVVASIEAAADGLQAGPQDRVIEAVGRARGRAAAADFPGALAAAADALAAYTAAVIATRG